MAAPSHRRRAVPARTPALPTGNVELHAQHHPHPSVPHHAPPPPQDNPELFVDLMMGAPLSIFVEKDVPDRDEIVRLIEVCVDLARYDTRSPSVTETWRRRRHGLQHCALHPW